MSVDRELSEYDLNTAASIARLEAKVDALIIRFDEAITTQVKDHGKRLGVLERRAVWQAGWIAGAGLAGSAMTAVIFKFLGL
ncbi:hypothetical protein [Desulfovibrio sp. ZJ369]|uniref:hypothetical protein n=1 Tax=Desulfovibrio sp. ZJ369 TaxID=2709793 RepID=UPI001F14C870|nr:hypothetical protein [Desulfovibrio sp. ZJ369]